MSPERFEPTPEKEDRFKDRILNLREQVIERLGMVEAHQRFTEFIYRLYQARPDCTTSKVYHWLKGSSPEKEYGEDDFEGEYSVEKFLLSLLEEKENPSSQ